MKKLLLIGFLATLSACTKPTPNLYVRGSEVKQPVQPQQYKPYASPTPLPVTPETADMVGKFGDIKADFNPKVDVLFVIDNSGSMADEQASLSQNINKFVAAFAKKPLIDYHIGVAAIWDTKRYTQFVPDFKNGQLWPVKSSQTKLPYVTKATPNTVQALAATLNIGIKEYTRDHGPTDEELFSPVKAALSDEANKTFNKGFLRPDAQLVVIMITDADDSSVNVGPSELAQALWDSKGGNHDLVSAYGVINVPVRDDIEMTDAIRNCMTQEDPDLKRVGGVPVRLIDFFERMKDSSTQKNTFSRCEPDYGVRLAEVGNEVSLKTMRKVIPLDGARPVTSKDGVLPIHVYYGNKEIPQDDSVGWTYNPENNSIIINGGVDITPVPGAQVVVKFTPVQ